MRYLLIACALLAGCGGADPTKPRDVRTVKPTATSGNVPAARDDVAPTRGLPCERQTGRLRLCGAATDNYKASFNADPDAPELRTWLAVHQVELDGARYKVAAGQELLQPTVRLVAVNPSGTKPATVQLAVRIVSGPASTVSFRTGPQKGLWGPLLLLDDRVKLKATPVVVDIALTGAGTTPAASVTLTYRYDKALAHAPKDSLEYGGPGGRWHAGGLSTGTNLELGWE